MVHCCVPFCTSKKNKPDEKAPSFHEFPLGKEVNQLWVKNIARKDWFPSDRDRICGIHFLPTDYKVGLKAKKLKADAVPTVFPNYPSYMQRARTQKPPRKLPTRTPLPAKPKPSVKPHQVGNLTTDDVGKTTTKGSVEPLENGIVQLGENEFIPPQVPEKKMVDRDAGVDLPCRKCRDQYQNLKVVRRKVLRKNRAIASLKHQVGELKSKYEALTSRFKQLNKFETVRSGAENGDVVAQFICQQVKAYKVKKPRWNEKLLRLFSVCHSISPQCYEFVKRHVAILPSRTTLSRFSENVCGEGTKTGVDSSREEAVLQTIQDVLDSAEMGDEAVAADSTSLETLEKVVDYGGAGTADPDPTSQPVVSAQTIDNTVILTDSYTVEGLPSNIVGISDSDGHVTMIDMEGVATTFEIVLTTEIAEAVAGICAQ